MQEVLSNTNDPKIPLREQEFYELSLLDVANQLGTRYCVRQAHAEWSEIDGEVMWDKEEADYFWILNEAKQRYAELRLAFVQRGFKLSNMDILYAPEQNNRPRDAALAASHAEVHQDRP
jgi:hypothetical protein